jgi:hypothetical protein
VFAVVEHQQPTAPVQRFGDAVGHVHPWLLGDAEYRRDRLGNSRRITDRSELDDERPVGEVVNVTIW